MPKAIQKIKRLPTEKTFWDESEICEQPPQELLTKTERPVDDDNKLKKLDLIRLNQEKIDNQNLPKPVDWELDDGDYKFAMTENEEHQVFSFEARRRLEKIFFGVVLVFVALIILLFSFMASSI